MVDIGAVAAAYYTALMLRFHIEAVDRVVARLTALRDVSPVLSLQDLERLYRNSAPRNIILVVVLVCGFYALLDLYAGTRLLRRQGEGRRIVRANLLALVCCYCLLSLLRDRVHSRSLLAMMMTVNAGYCAGGRALLSSLLTRACRRFGIGRCPAILVGCGRESDFIDEWLTLDTPRGVSVAARVPYEPEQGVDAMLRSVSELIIRHDARMIICADLRLSLEQVLRVLKESEPWGVVLKVLTNEMNVIPQESRLRLDLVMDCALLHFASYPSSRAYMVAKRLFSLTAGCLALALLSPVLLLVYLLVRLTSAGPGIFVQDRVGHDRKLFAMYKFRTMFQDAEHRQAEMEQYNEACGVLFKIRNDPRLTRVGRVLRRYSLDELPQLINVVRGEMMLVGPRPLPLRDVANYSADWHFLRHQGYPGCTGLWQVSGRSDVDFHHMCILDVYYLRNQGPLLDAKIILRTIPSLLLSSSAY